MGDWRIVATTFGLLFLAELGDKTQLSTILMTAKTGKPLYVFLGAATALVVVTLLGVVFGVAVTKIIPPYYLQKGAAVLFVLIGLLMFFGRF